MHARQALYQGSYVANPQSTCFPDHLIHQPQNSLKAQAVGLRYLQCLWQMGGSLFKYPWDGQVEETKLRDYFGGHSRVLRGDPGLLNVLNTSWSGGTS